MSYVAFDLDNTLAYVYHIMPVAYFFSVETLENSSCKGLNTDFRLSRRLRNALHEAEARFIQKVIARPHLVRLILRPNIDALMRPIIRACQTGRVNSVAIYSNTENTFSMRLVIALLEARYSAPGLFCAAVDATHPIRRPDYDKVVDGEPLKTYPVLKRMFVQLCGVRESFVKPSNVIFIDERPKKHAVSIYETEGLTYVKPTVYAPDVPMSHKREVLKLLMETLDEEGLLYDREYIESPVFRCFRRIYGTNRDIHIDSFDELLAYCSEDILKAGAEAIPFQDDTVALRRSLLRALARAE